MDTSSKKNSRNYKFYGKNPPANGGNSKEIKSFDVNQYAIKRNNQLIDLNRKMFRTFYGSNSGAVAAADNDRQGQ